MSVLMLLLVLNSFCFADTSGKIVLKDGTVFESVSFETFHSTKTMLISLPESAQKRIVSFADIKEISDINGNNITSTVLDSAPLTPVDADSSQVEIDTSLIPRPTSRENEPKPQIGDSIHNTISLDDDWIETPDAHIVDQREIDVFHEKSIFHRSSKERPRTFNVMFRIGGFYSIPNGWADKIKSAVGFDGQFIVGFKNRMGLGVNVSHTNYQLEDSYFRVITSPDLIVIDKNADVRIDYFFLTFGGFWPLSQEEVCRTIGYLEIRGGAYYRKLTMASNLRNIYTGLPLDVSWEESITEGAASFSAGIIQCFTRNIAISFGLTVSNPILEGDTVPEDLPFEYTPPKENKPDKTSLNFRLSLIYLL